MAELWAEVLEVDRETIPADTDFFQLGGHSLKATLVTSRMHQAFNVEIPLGEMFRQPTIRGLAKYIEEAESRNYSSIQPVEKKEYYPLSSAQQRLYILQQMDPDSAVYNMPQAMNLAGRFDREKLEETFNRLIRRHEVFRTSFITVNETPVQRIPDEVEFNIQYFDLAANRANGREEEEIMRAFIRPFDLSEAPLMRVGWIELGETEQLLLVDIHHIISDGTSVRVMVSDFLALFRDETLPPQRIQYKDYSLWQNSDALKWKMTLREEFWLKEFRGEVPVLNLPFDGKRGEVQDFRGSNFKFFLDETETAALNKLAQDRGVTLFMVLVTLFNILLFRLSRQEDIVIGTPTAGRGHVELERLIGMFINTLALRNFPAPGKTLDGFLSEVKERTLNAFENQDYQFEDLVERIVVTRNPGRSPLFDVMMGLQNMQIVGSGADYEESEPEETDREVSEQAYDLGVSRFDMTWNGIELDGRLEFAVEYSTRLFLRETIQRFTGCFKQLAAFIVKGDERSLAETPISRIEIIPAAEKERILNEFNATQGAYPETKTVHEMVVDQINRTPDNIALTGNDGTANGKEERLQLTYRELEIQST
ncbi:MAG: non-ribosomal peptide synthetase, partial [bacterium]|nr:non-ribosomal peptide synthetase [bacterium]